MDPYDILKIDIYEQTIEILKKLKRSSLRKAAENMEKEIKALAKEIQGIKEKGLEDLTLEGEIDFGEVANVGEELYPGYGKIYASELKDAIYEAEGIDVFDNLHLQEAVRKNSKEILARLGPKAYNTLIRYLERVRK